MGALVVNRWFGPIKDKRLAEMCVKKGYWPRAIRAALFALAAGEIVCESKVGGVAAKILYSAHQGQGEMRQPPREVQ